MATLRAALPDLDTGEVRERLSSKKGFVWLKREITPKQQQDIHRLGIPGMVRTNFTGIDYDQGQTEDGALAIITARVEFAARI